MKRDAGEEDISESDLYIGKLVDCVEEDTVELGRKVRIPIGLCTQLKDTFYCKQRTPQHINNVLSATVQISCSIEQRMARIAGVTRHLRI